MSFDKDKFGPPSKAKCCVCDGHKNNQSEPRFGYTVCEDHQHVPPAYLGQAQRAYAMGLVSVITIDGRDFIIRPRHNKEIEPYASDELEGNEDES